MPNDMKTYLHKYLNHQVYCVLRYGAENTPHTDAHGYLKEVGDDYIRLYLPDITDGFGSDQFDEVIGAETVVSLKYVIDVTHWTDCRACSDMEKD